MPVSFPSTRWTLILARSKSEARDETEDRRLVGDLCRDYWKPVYSYLRAAGTGREDAEDLTQGFFAAALESDLFEDADPGRGRMRSYLLGALKHYVGSERRRQGAQKRGGLVRFVPLDTGEEERSRRLRLEPAAPELPPDLAFDRRWAECLLEATLVRIKSEFAAAGKIRHYEVLRPFLDGGGDPAGAARELGIGEGALRVMLHRFRKRYRERVRAEIRQTLAPGEEVADEFAHLLAALGGEKSR
jgi:DNA-directed RNA polymerase specialized sigma24 family protein